MRTSNEDYQRLIQDLENADRDGKRISIKNPGHLTLQLKSNWSNLRYENDLILLNNRLIIPAAMRKKITSDLHYAHQGLTKTLQRARRSVYWPGINNDIKQTIENCIPCQEKRPSLQKEPYQSDANPTRPFEEVSSDMFSIGGKQFLIYVCRYSGFPLLAQWNQYPTSQQLVNVCQKFFSDLGVPTIFRSDGGTVYASRTFQDFLARWNVTWKVSSPGYPQSNGYAECYVKSLKHMLSKMDSIDIGSEQFQKALLEYRNTPRFDNRSPNEVVFGRTLRSFIPTHASAFDPKWAELSKMNEKTKAHDEQVRKHYNATAKELPRLDAGERVFVQNQVTKRWDTQATIISFGTRLRNYRIKFDDGRKLWRNRRFLRPTKQPAEETIIVNSPLEREKDEKDVSNEPRRSTRCRKPPVRFTC